jgi:hypothetical protein
MDLVPPTLTLILIWLVILTVGIVFVLSKVVRGVIRLLEEIRELKTVVNDGVAMSLIESELTALKNSIDDLDSRLQKLSKQ